MLSKQVVRITVSTRESHGDEAILHLRRGCECGIVTRPKNVRARLKYYGLKHEGRNGIVAIKRIRTKLQIFQLGKYESSQ